MTVGNANPDMIISAFQTYSEHDALQITQSDFHDNLVAKMKLWSFVGDIKGLLGPAVEYDPYDACSVIEKELIARL